MVGSRDGEAVAVHPVPNRLKSPLRYDMDPNEQHKAWTSIEDAGLELGVIYHSHTRSAPVPSQTDINLAKFGPDGAPRFPGTLYLIVGLEGPQADLRLWSIVGDDVEQVELQVTE
jgi:proteasome lid subunit RPN8/RPN11